MVARHTESKIFSDDGTELSLQQWMPTESAPFAEVLLIHGYADHCGRYREFAHFLAKLGIAMTAVDLRGHGNSSGQRGFVDNFEDYHLDVEVARKTLNPNLPHFLLGHSTGGLIILDYIRGGNHGFKGIILSNPFVGWGIKVSLPKLWLGIVAGKVLPRLPAPNGIRSEILSHDPEVVKEHKLDPLIFSTATAGWFREVNRAQERVLALNAVEPSLLYIYSDEDRLGDPAVNAKTAERLSAPEKKIILRKGEFHEILLEENRTNTYHHIGAWISAQS